MSCFVLWSRFIATMPGRNDSKSLFKIEKVELSAVITFLSVSRRGGTWATSLPVLFHHPPLWGPSSIQFLCAFLRPYH